MRDRKRERERERKRERELNNLRHELCDFKCVPDIVKVIIRRRKIDRSRNTHRIRDIKKILQKV